jgi:hypothetical protein
MFDAEIILRALAKGYRIREFPVEWNSDPDSRFRFFRASFQSLYDLTKVKIILNREKKQALKSARLEANQSS